MSTDDGTSRNPKQDCTDLHQTAYRNAPIGRTRQAQLMRWATYASVSVAVCLIFVKTFGWWMTGSASILASLLDSTMDALVSLLNLFAVRYALTPPDNEHRFGHGKAEPLASLCQAIIIAASALLLAKHAFDGMSQPYVITTPGWGVIVMALSLVSTVGLLFFQRYVVQQTHSTAIKADSLHYLGDVVTQGAALVVLLLAEWGWYSADAYLALIIAGYVFHSAWGIGRDSFHALMDHELSSETRSQVKNLVRAHPEVRGLHDLKTRRSGPTVFIQMHVELDDHIPLIQAHRISDEVEAVLLNRFPHAEILIHQDPVSQYQPTSPSESSTPKNHLRQQK